MIPKMHVTGTGSVVSMLSNVAERVRDNARKHMLRAGERVEKLAKLQAPVDLYNLEESIRLEKDYVGARGRLQVSIVAGGMVGDVNVDEYAMLVHENYESLGEPGEGTREKMAAHPEVQIGSKFLERAADNERKRLEGEMIEVVQRSIRQ